MPESDRRSVLCLWATAISVVVVVVLGMGVRATTQRTDLVQSNGVPLENGVVRLSTPRNLACENAFVLAAPTRILRLWATGVGASAPPVDVFLRDAVSRTPLADGRAAASAEGLRPVVVRLSRVVSDARPVDVCVRTAGRGRLDLFGTNYTGPGRVTPDQQQLVARGFGLLPGDFRVDVLRPHPSSLLARLPRAFVRAGTFKPLGVGAWTWWLAIALAVGVAPVVLVRAVANASREDEALEPTQERGVPSGRSPR